MHFPDVTAVPVAHRRAAEAAGQKLEYAQQHVSDTASALDKLSCAPPTTAPMAVCRAEPAGHALCSVCKGACVVRTMQLHQIGSSVILPWGCLVNELAS